MKLPICVAVLLVASNAHVGASERAGAQPTMTAAECEVWNRERSFAQSIERGDAVAFADHVRPDAVFQAGTPTPQRGRAAVVEAWQPMIRGEFPLRWHPGLVHIGGDPDIALSHGPAWIEDPDPKAASRFRLGSFVSTWVRDADGVWRVLFDRSAQPMREATMKEVAALRAKFPEQCPQG